MQQRDVDVLVWGELADFLVQSSRRLGKGGGVIFLGGVTDVTSLYQTLRFLGLDQTMSHLCKTNR